MRLVALAFVLLAYAVACSGLLGVNDVTFVDGGPADGGGTDGPESGAARDAGGTWCATQTGLAFCEDFDRPDAGLAAAWDFVQPSNLGASLSIDPATSASAPNSLLAIVPAESTGGRQVIVIKHFGPLGKIRLAADIVVEAGDPQSVSNALAIVLSPPPLGYTEYDLNLDLLSDGCTLTAYAAYPDGGAARGSSGLGVSFGAWKRIQIELTLGENPVGRAFDEAGNTLAELTMPKVISRGTQVELGAPFISAAGARTTSKWQVRFDNVTVSGDGG
jgi:hypothetical protein